MMAAVERIEPLASSVGLERMAAYFRGHAFAPHRHATYAVGVTTFGVQSFDYRSANRSSLPGDVFVLHPDETHDGRAGDARGFGYRIAYLDPSLVREAAGMATFPFLRDPISREPKLRRAIVGLTDPDRCRDEVDAVGLLTATVTALCSAADLVSQRSAPPLDRRAVRRARDLLAARLEGRVTMAELEAETGLDRWTLARQFRSTYGVSPSRFQLLRRLDRACALISQGLTLADAALATGFADQAHLTRQFRSAYGLSPGRWRALALRIPGAPLTPS
jgi:AraC-like DNA-binding protein